MSLASIGSRFPKFAVPAVVSLEAGKEFATITDESFQSKWSVVFFWPLDFTFVCPTEIAAFNQRLGDFHERGTQVFGVSTDSKFVHLAWRRAHPDLHDLNYPLLADNKKDLSDALGVLHPTEKVPLRATFIVDPEGIVR